jgi:hypothetical protein
MMSVPALLAYLDNVQPAHESFMIDSAAMPAAMRVTARRAASGMTAAEVKPEEPGISSAGDAGNSSEIR